jgi:hypothetical protein
LYGTIKANFYLIYEVTAHTDTLRDLKFQVLETSFDVIIGRPEIIKYQLGAKLPGSDAACGIGLGGQALGAISHAKV